MAVIPWTIEAPPAGMILPEGVKIVMWETMANADTGTPYLAAHYPDKSVQVTGTFGAGGNCRIEGTNFLATPTYATLTDPQGNALDVTAAKIEQVVENTWAIRPNITAGDGTTSITVRLLIFTGARR